MKAKPCPYCKVKHARSNGQTSRVAIVQCRARHWWMVYAATISGASYKPLGAFGLDRSFVEWAHRIATEACDEVERQEGYA